MKNGLDGLGIINTKNDSATVGSPLQSATGGINADTRLLDLGLTVSQTDEFTEYVKNWAGNTGVAQLYNCEPSLANVGGAFGLKLDCDESIVYNIVPCADSELAKQIYQSLTSGEHTQKCVLVCPHTFEYNDIRKGLSLGVELLGYNEAQEINSAITSPVTYLAVGESFVHKISKALNSIYCKHNSEMAMNRVKETFTGDGNGTGGIAEALKQGFDQLKSSVLGAVGNKSDFYIQQKEKIRLPDITSSETNGVTIEQEENFSVPEYGTNITAGTMGGDEYTPSLAESGEDIVTCGTLSRDENTIYTTGEEVESTDNTVHVNIEKTEDTEV